MGWFLDGAFPVVFGSEMVMWLLIRVGLTSKRMALNPGRVDRSVDGSSDQSRAKAGGVGNASCIGLRQMVKGERRRTHQAEGKNKSSSTTIEVPVLGNIKMGGDDSRCETANRRTTPLQAP